MVKKLLLLVIFAAVLPLSAQQRDTVRYYEELIGTMNQRVKQLQDDNARLEAKVTELRNRQAELARSNQKLKEEMDSIRQLVRQDAESRKNELQKLHGQLKKLSELPAAPPAAPRSGKSNAPAVYEEYVVEAGATLSAIAKAYEVSVGEIKRANKLKNDFLRVGQRLKIPVK